jgi:hypothetical protein
MVSSGIGRLDFTFFRFFTKGHVRPKRRRVHWGKTLPGSGLYLRGVVMAAHRSAGSRTPAGFVQRNRRSLPAVSRREGQLVWRDQRRATIIEGAPTPIARKRA